MIISPYHCLKEKKLYGKHKLQFIRLELVFTILFIASAMVILVDFLLFGCRRFLGCAA